MRLLQLTWESTVCTEGMRKPWDTPTHTRAKVMAKVLLAFEGVKKDATDHMRKQMLRTLRPPYS